MSDLPDSRVVNGRTIKVQTPGLADKEDGVLPFVYVSVDFKPDSISATSAMFPKNIEEHELQAVIDEMEAMEDEYYDEEDTFTERVKEIAGWDKHSIPDDEVLDTEFDGYAELKMAHGTDEDMWRRLQESDEVEVTHVSSEGDEDALVLTVEPIE